MVETVGGVAAGYRLTDRGCGQRGPGVDEEGGTSEPAADQADAAAGVDDVPAEDPAELFESDFGAESDFDSDFVPDFASGLPASDFDPDSAELEPFALARLSVR